MRKRILLMAAPLVVVAIAASVAVASPSDAERSRGPRLDKLHAERPTAASDSNATLSPKDSGFQKAATDIQNYVKAVNVQEYDKLLQINDYLRLLGAQVVGEYLVSVLPAERAQSTGVPQVTSAVYSSTYPGDFLSCVRNRESGGNYGVYNSGGSGAAGAYQFMPGTWNGIAASSGRGDLVGVDPAQASPADQDAMAQALYAQQGSAPWGGAC